MTNTLVKGHTPEWVHDAVERNENEEKEEEGKDGVSRVVE